MEHKRRKQGQEYGKQCRYRKRDIEEIERENENETDRNGERGEINKELRERQKQRGQGVERERATFD